MDGGQADAEYIEIIKEQDRRAAQRSFLHYYMRMTGFMPPPHFKKIAKLLQAMEDDKIDRAMLFAPPRHIKRLADDTPMLTANRGWTTHGDLRAGDRVWHPSGNAVKVAAVHPPGQSDLLVTFSNGEEIQCDEGHLWTVWDRGKASADRYRRKVGSLPPGGKTWETLTTGEILARGLMANGAPGKRGGRYRWQMPDCYGIDGEAIKTHVQPYTLGVWLGDGSSKAPRLTLCPEDMPVVLKAVEADGYAHNRTFWHKDTGVPTLDFSTARRDLHAKGISPLRADLQAEGVFGDKHIPDRWMTASRQQRKELLAGLMDSDGHCERDTGRCRIVSSIPRLAQGIHDLAASLGYRPYITEAAPGATAFANWGDAGTRKVVTRKRVYTVGFQPHEPLLCRLERKRPIKIAMRRAVTIQKIERVAPKSSRCISVSAPDGLYLAGRKLVPTHNTLGASILMPSWIMGRHPQTPIMSVAHTDRYAQKIGGKVRNLVRSPQWPWPEVTLAGDTAAKQAFATPQGGEYNAFGMFGGNQHGNPAEWLFMDDIIKGRKIALSPHMRDEAWDTYRTDLLSRLQGRAKQLMVFTRWHQDDPAGRILPENYDGQSGWYQDRETGEKWYVLSLPAVAEHENDPMGRAPGEWLWPDQFSEAKLGGMRKRGGWVWSALFQQRPSPEEGLMFQAHHLETQYSPGTLNLTGLEVYISSDYAVTEEAGANDPDYTVHLVWGVDQDWNVYLLDGWRGRSSADTWAREWIRLCKKWKPLRAGEESGQIIKGVGPFLKMMMQKEQVYVSRVQLHSGTSKEQRAHALLGMMEMGKVFMPRKTEIHGSFLALVEAFEKELLQFPAGRHDDIVDAATLFGRMLDKIIAGRDQPRRDPHTGETLDDLWEQHDEKERRRQDDA